MYIVIDSDFSELDLLLSFFLNHTCNCLALDWGRLITHYLHNSAALPAGLPSAP